MMRRYGPALALGIALTSGPAHARITGHWTATGTASIAVTGNITVTANTLIFGNGRTLKLIPEGVREGVWTPALERGSGAIYRISPPTDPKLLQGTALCGWPVTYIVLSQGVPGRLDLSVFHSKTAPRRVGDDLCAYYSYERE